MKKSLNIIFTIILLCVSFNAQTTAGNKTSETTPGDSAKPKAFRPTKTQITEAQEKLKAAGSYAGAVDGKYNDDFRASLKKYQGENSLEKNGKLDEATIVKMGIMLTDSQKGESPESESTEPKAKRVSFRANKSQITEAQKSLKTNGSYKGEETGKYNDDFRAAVKEFQGANGLKKSGSLNRATLEKMGIALTDAQSAIPANPNDLSTGTSTDEPKKRGPVFRASKEQIMEVQKMLKAKNLYSGEETGKLDDDTRAGIKSWQKENGVKETGTLNKETLEAMKIELTDKQKAM